MSNAWETTADDVSNVLRNRGVGHTRSYAILLVEKLDHEAIKDYALSETDFDKQVEMAYREIDRQLVELGKLPAELQD